jgi:hypothetical protein
MCSGANLARHVMVFAQTIGPLRDRAFAHSWRMSVIVGAGDLRSALRRSQSGGPSFENFPPGEERATRRLR